MEATIAVMIVSGVLLVVYSKQIDRGVSPADYFGSLQGQILADVSSRNDLRLNVLSVINETSEDSNFVALNNFVGGKIPSAFGYLLRVCVLGSETDYCKMDDATFIATMDKDIYVEEIIISAELGEGIAVYNPKKVKLFVWEGGYPEGFCVGGCYPHESIQCINETNYKTCDYFGTDCLEWSEGSEECPSNYICKVDDCVPGWAELGASYSGLRTEISAGITYVYYYLSISENGGGIYVDLESRQRCWLDGTCESLVYDAEAKFGTSRVDAGSSISTIDERYFYTNIYPDRMIETWRGTDELGNSIEVSYSIEVPLEGSVN